ncbi:hypothetical protein INR49_010128 [Caranx melampygus]|nr:hypothetical protein INR49_010128 [Caranx melampygus]
MEQVMSLREKVVHENLKTALSNPHMIFVLLTPSKMTSPGSTPGRSTQPSSPAAGLSANRAEPTSTSCNILSLFSTSSSSSSSSSFTSSSSSSFTCAGQVNEVNKMNESLQVELQKACRDVEESEREVERCRWSGSAEEQSQREEAEPGGKGVEEEEDRGREKNLLLQEAVRALFSCSSLFHSQTLTLDAFLFPPSAAAPSDTTKTRTMKTSSPFWTHDTEDLFGDYDSLLEDSSLLAKLDDAEQCERQRDVQAAAVDQQDVRTVHQAEDAGWNRSCQDNLTDSILDGLGDEPFENLPSSQVQFEEQVDDHVKRSRLQDGGQTSTPFKDSGGMTEERGGRREEEKTRRSRGRRSVADQLKRTMLGNAASPSNISRTAVLKQAVVSEEISVAVQAMETVSAETPDLGPFYGLPSKRAAVQEEDCLFILPYISLVQEKVRGLASFGLELDFMVEEYAGSKGKFPPVKRRNKSSLYVATIEKGHSLVNSLIEAGRLENLGLLVVDELHMLGDGGRGAVIEMTLAKVLFMSKKTQIIGMSATLGNIRDLQTFLQADNYTNDFRPVQLKEFVKLNDTIYEVDPKEEDCFRFSRLLNYKYSSAMQKMDPDHIIALVTEVIPAHSCLVFCPTKKNCENVAGMICKYLKDGGGSLCPVLRRTVPFGLAYHHSGLTTEERRLVEEAYSNGVLCLLTCTSTLAAGINLPARRVILRSPYVASDFLKRSQYKQMVGRAGRAGIDSVGESILILQNKDRDMAKTLVCAPMENCYSNLMQDGGKGLLSLILSLIGLNMCTSVEQVGEFLKGTLLSVQQTELCVDQSLSNVVMQCVDELTEKKLVTMTMQDLSRGLEALMLNSYLHLVYLVTPYDLVSQVKPDWMVYFRQFTLLSAAEQRMSAAVGVPESFVARKAAGQTVKNSADPAVACRMYLALVLFSLLKETDLWLVSSRFQLSRGFVQTLLSSSSAFCSCVLHFTEELEELWPFRALLTELTRRLSYCVKAELIPLMEVTGVMECRAKQLYDAGYRTLTHLANADPALLSRSIENLYRKQANQIVASAKMLLSEKASALQEEVDELLAPPTDLPTAEGVSPGGPDSNDTVSGALDVAVDVDLSAVTHRVDPRFLSVTIDASLATEEKFMYLLGSPKLRTMAQALSPGFLRFGGTRQDFMIFSPQRTSSGVHTGVHTAPSAPTTCDHLLLPDWLEQRLKEEWTQHQVTLLKEELQRKYSRVEFTEKTVDLLHGFANCSGLQLIFGLNALLRTSANVWNSSNAHTLLQYCESRGYRIHWELGNEPNSFEKKAGVRVDGVQLGLDFTHLREIMSQSVLYRDAGLYGPDVGQPRDHRIDILEGFLQTGAEAIDACTWHHYYVNGRDTSLEDFLDPEVLDTLILKTNEVLEKVNQVSPGKTVWLGETSSAYGGGAPGLSDTFAAGFIPVQTQQFLMFLDWSQSDSLVQVHMDLRWFRIENNQSWILSAEVMWGQRWLDKLGLAARLGLDVVMRQVYRPGAVTLVSMNLSRRTSRISSPPLVSSSSTVEAFVLQSEQPGEEGLYSRSVKLNGRLLSMLDDHTLPDLSGARLPPAEHLQLPALSLAFFVFPDARAAACYRHGDLR